MEAPGSLVVDPVELERFVGWLPGIEAWEALVVLLMVRSRGLREVYRTAASEHVLAAEPVHGALRGEAPGRGWELWRELLLDTVRRLGVLGARGPWRLPLYERGGRGVRGLEPVPWQVAAVYIGLNPGDAVKAARLLAGELLDTLYDLARLGGRELLPRVYRDPRRRYAALLAWRARSRTRFHSIDVDSPGLAGPALDMARESLGYTPPTIRTDRGLHILIDLERLRREGLIARYTGSPLPGLDLGGVRAGEALRLLEEGRPLPERVRRALEEYARSPRVPLYHRLRVLGLLHRGPTGAPLVEVKREALEPAPGTLYKGRTVVRFDPGD